VLSTIGRAVDRSLAARADAVAAIAPALRDVLEQRCEREVAYLPVPWAVPTPATVEERREARESLRLGADDDVLLYAGNLDAYQGWELLLPALERVARRRDRARLLVGTESDAAPLTRAAAEAGVADRLVVTRLDGEAARRRIHAAADVAVVPRRSPGGLPIKLLDALARGVPSVCASRAAAGLDLRGAAMIAADDDPDALAAAVLTTLSAPAAARDLASRARAYIQTDHAPERFFLAFDDLVATLDTR
jgi:glycosyltransferase involved in cell wall biosynthesis